MTTRYTFYTVETDPIRPFLIITRSHRGSSEAMKALTSNPRIKFMSADKSSAERVADKMSEAMRAVMR